MLKMFKLYEPSRSLISLAIDGTITTNRPDTKISKLSEIKIIFGTSIHNPIQKILRQLEDDFPGVYV
jgi:hypothetical protein